MNSKRKIVGLAISIGLIAGLSVMLSSAQTRAFNPMEAAGNVAAYIIDMDQELGSSDTEVRVARSSELAFDESQETGGNYPVSKVTLPQQLAFDESQETGGNYPVSKVTLPQQLVFDADQEGGTP
jgi:hypothetical protein